MPTKQELQLLQSLDLETKIKKTRLRIKEWIAYWGEEGVYISFSGGKDSTVLLHLVRSLYPNIPAVFADTGLEYPEIRQFVKSFNNVIWVKPKLTFKEIIEKYGYPVISKKTSKQIRRLQNPSEKNAASRKLSLTGIKRDGTKSKMGKMPEKWKFLINAPFKISEQCCQYMKKEPFHRYEKKTNRHAFVGIMASDSRDRETAYLQTGCNSFKKNGNSTPLGFWKEEDIWKYIEKYNIPYCNIYDTGVKRTGCMFCCLGVHLEKQPNRFQLMQKTHPKQYQYCISGGKFVGEKLIPYKGLGLAKVLDFLRVKYKEEEES
ncbi:phosphoadenosine phosphosulfate reductase family protein [Clostridium kluyveri]|uniref:phosphoadenosine phosphosulfate reductase family protein n=1 Tax=Clostridium kluyveri TaxID=1534 RepID=UPI002245F439|nr:phosphoadenosine phosphosulfate reductase family protein [Clostridium kluyveri]UZQ51615.1 phosphoadenosine phosphosulfate reductase family protein [Clostridium kluyveri]